ncbi:uncharacterized protein F4807DRAFT_455532 [Annulohypoxylon truncatum]|uniref:uncharacterized protein n=1 Tax=Annulohypoxylon truncatum TaxID=327061 RepID=UPI002007D1E1|nr:uncharacterized protein F4807DRAFT_455532 [Annulohypoxylon truncatum]KAI1215082.1 hypothetical protein F4807DRAFT_455532 [Annulohypoxylon truncatum]
MNSPVPCLQDGFTRPLGNLENFFKLLAKKGKPLKREHWTVHLALCLQFPGIIADPVPYLRRAWQVLRLQHPTLGATLQSSNDIAQPAPSRLIAGPLNLGDWANQTFVVYDEVACADQLFPNLLSTPTATCYWLPKSSELVIKSSHRRTDGVGMALLGRHFMLALSGTIRSGHDCPLEVLVPNIGKEPSVPQASSITTIEVSTACRNRGIKVTSAVHAAIVRVTANFPQHPLSKSYTAFVPVDLRLATARTAASDAKIVSEATGVYFSGLPLCISSVLPEDGKPREEFEAIARELGAVYARDLNHFWTPPGSAGQTISLLDLVEPYVR